MAAVVGPDGRTQYVYTISGVRVEFPVKAYPSQIAMMDKVSLRPFCNENERSPIIWRRFSLFGFRWSEEW